MKKILFSLIFLLAGCLFISAQDTTLKQYVGKYKIPDAEMEITIKLNKDTLIMTFPAGTSPLQKLGVDTFDAIHLRIANKVVFMRNDAKKVNRISLSFNDMTLEGKKEE